ncbi:MAG: hypothetical protein EHM19_00510 [Candidatus Latescibacterota bacterium]|nr:MAG: hypothetical protein EHM19_00510 [Candidatus Latescibacterota bacterium]
MAPKAPGRAVRLALAALALITAWQPASAVERLVLFPESSTWKATSARIEAAGGRIRQAFPPGAAVLDGAETFWSAFLAADGSVRVFDGPVEEATFSTLPRDQRFAALGWNRRFAPKQEPAPSGPAMMNDAAPGERGNPGPGKMPPGAGFFDTSEFMLGTVAIALLLPESNGAIDPSTENWTQAEIDSVVAEIQEGVPFWIDHAPGGNLSFVYRFEDPVSIPYEAISRPAFSAKEESLWVRAVFDTLGYGSGDTWYRARSYLNDLRDSLATDWAVAIFVADSKADADGRFSNGIYGFSYYGGPYLVMTYDNNTWGIGNMHAVAAHEIAHSFYALDEYYSAHKPCHLAAGYELVPNQNSDYGTCFLDENCIMRAGMAGAFDSSLACVYTRGQVGLGDTDEDGIANILDTYPTTLLDPFPDSTSDESPTIAGSAEDAPILNRNTIGAGNDITLNTIERVEYRIDGGEWIEALAADGAFDSLYEEYVFTTAPLAETTHVVEVRAVNSAGNADTTFAADTFVVHDGTAPAPPSPVFASASDSEVVLVWTNAPDSDLEAVMVRWGTSGFPADTADGALLALRPASPGSADTVVHAGLLPDTTYYYSIFSLDEVPNTSVAGTASATPLYPPPPAVLYSPPDGALHVVANPLFVWSAIPLGGGNVLVAYQIQVATDSLFTLKLIDLEATTGYPADTAWTSDSLGPGELLWWRVRGKDVSSGTYGLWSGGSQFATELPVEGLAFLDSTLSSYSNFASGDSLEANANARIEVRVVPADTLGIGEFETFVHWGGASPDSAPLAWDRNEGGAGYWRGEIPYGIGFSRGDTVDFRVSARAPTEPAIVDDNGGSMFRFIAGRRAIGAWHVPSAEEPFFSMRSPYVPLDTDSEVVFTIGASPADAATGGTLRCRVAPDGPWGSVPLLPDTAVGDTAYLAARLDSTFLLGELVEYYVRVEPGATYDTTFLFGDNEVSHAATVEQSALALPFVFLVQSATGVGERPPASAPARSVLLANRPNPFNPETAIPFALATAGRVNVTVYDARGRTVRVLLDETLMPGWHAAEWDGRMESGTSAPSGVYFAVVRAGSWRATEKLLLLR